MFPLITEKTLFDQLIFSLLIFCCLYCKKNIYKIFLSYMVLFKCTKKYIIIYIQLSKYFRLYATSNKNLGAHTKIELIMDLYNSQSFFFRLSKYFRLYATTNKNMWRSFHIKKL